MYSPLSDAFLQVAIEMIYTLVQTLIYSLLLLSMVGPPRGVGKFWWFYYYVFMSLSYFILYGMMLVALTPNYHIDAISMAFFLNFWNLFSGFNIPRTVAWTLYGLVTSQVGDKTDPVQVAGFGDIPVNVYLKETFGFTYDFLRVVAVGHLVWVLLQSHAASQYLLLMDM